MFCLAYFSFNSMIVRLKVYFLDEATTFKIRFNSMIVRLKVYFLDEATTFKIRFNSMIVRLKEEYDLLRNCRRRVSIL